jgi:hypothetical protein
VRRTRNRAGRTGDPVGLQKAPAVRCERHIIGGTIHNISHGASSWVEFSVVPGVSDRPSKMSTPRTLFDPDRSAESLPVSLVTGFLGSGKRRRNKDNLFPASRAAPATASCARFCTAA